MISRPTGRRVSCHFLFLNKRLYLFIFRKRGREGEREGEKHQCVFASHMAPTGDLAHNLGMCPDWESNWRPFGPQPMLNPLSYSSQGPFSVLKVAVVQHNWQDQGLTEK